MTNLYPIYQPGILGTLRYPKALHKKTTVELFIGNAIVNQFTDNEISLFANEYSKKLSAHTETMLQLTPAEVKGLVYEGLFVICSDASDKTRILSVARLLIHAPDTFELCGWYALVQGFGKYVIPGVILLARQTNPHASVFAVMQKANILAQNALVKRGAQKLKEKPSQLHIYLTDAQGDTAYVCYFKIL